TLLACGASPGTPTGSSRGVPIQASAPSGDDPAGWRASHRIIDLHEHIEPSPERYALALRVMDAVGIGVAVNLSGGTVTPLDRPDQDGTPANEFAVAKDLTDRRFPGRFLHYMNLDYKSWDEADFAEQAVRQIEKGGRLGAAGFKEFKRLGLYLRDGKGK